MSRLHRFGRRVSIEGERCNPEAMLLWVRRTAYGTEPADHTADHLQLDAGGAELSAVEIADAVVRAGGGDRLGPSPGVLQLTLPRSVAR
jgi:hypothetical protein